MSKRAPILELIENENTSDQQKAVFENILRIRQFASEHLLLPNNESYNSYVDLDREYVVWNVFATPEFSLTPIRSCFIFVGCLQYKGFFAKQDAVDFATELRESGNDVYVGGVSAYSTLGWFDDPVFSSMLAYGEFRLANVIFHELAHQLIYIKDDSAFNEAFATSVGDFGVRRWLEENQRKVDLTQLERSNQWESEFIDLVLKTKGQLEELYTSETQPDQMKKQKEVIFAKLQSDYQALKASWDNPPDYDKWMAHDLNNAKISSVVTYHDLAGSFSTLLSLSDNDLPLFYQRVRFLGSLSKEDRHECLQSLSGQELVEQDCYE